ncbi:MAG: hypothetical protein KAX49_13110 [Halanaerobiales bacterium]|nr:hypothetical protein [Halanaerobiales bacterium]
MKWINAPKKIPKNKLGFVYEIRELSTGMRYIGQTKFWKIVKLKPLKGKQNKRHIKKETKWRIYNSSNKILQKKIKKHPSNYEKIIIKYCETKTEMRCWETYLQLTFWVEGHWDQLYNQCINMRGRIR